MKSIPHNIYIHVPYCKSKCRYCAFFSQPCAEPDWTAYTKRICNEIIQWGDRLGRIDVPTIFFGGGTPSLIPVQSVVQILQTIHNTFEIQDNAEITLESNPATIDGQKLQDLQKVGINRLSIGVQRLNDDELNFLGRIHSAHDAIDLINTAQDIGLRVSGDFIYGIPNDTPETVANICAQINSSGLTHCSLYELTIENDTPFGKMKLNMPNNNEMANMYQTITDKLKLPRYEISNYAYKGSECIHNQNVWDGEAYIGIGASAAGRVFINNSWYEQMGNNETFKKISDDERAVEKILTGMRTVRGCQLTQDVKKVIDIEWVLNHPEYVMVIGNRISATERGMLILDNIIANVVK